MKEYSICDCLAHWAKNHNVYVNAQNEKGDWLHDKEGYSWKPLWIIEEFYRYTSWVYTDFRKPDTPENFQSHWDGIESDLAELIAHVWFDEVERIGRRLGVNCNRDNKTAIRIRNRLTGQILYIGWYDNRITVGDSCHSEHPAIKLLDD